MRSVHRVCALATMTCLVTVSHSFSAGPGAKQAGNENWLARSSAGFRRPSTTSLAERTPLADSKQRGTRPTARRASAPTSRPRHPGRAADGAGLVARVGLALAGYGRGDGSSPSPPPLPRWRRTGSITGAGRSSNGTSTLQRARTGLHAIAAPESTALIASRSRGRPSWRSGRARRRCADGTERGAAGVDDPRTRGVRRARLIGTLQPTFSPNGQKIDFQAVGTTVLRYAELEVRDAAGRRSQLGWRAPREREPVQSGS